MPSVAWRRQERCRPSFGRDEIAQDQHNFLTVQRRPPEGVLALWRRFRLWPW